MLDVLRWRVGIVVAAVAVSALLAFGLLDCAEPTQIVVSVYSDACDGPGKTQAIHQTGIAVASPDAIDARIPSAVRDGCEKPAVGGVGTLTIYPSGANDAEVAIKVVAAIDTDSADKCVPPEYAGCIAQRRVLKFIPNTTQRVTVRLTLACLNRTCPVGNTCDNGVCKKETDVLVDGGTAPNASILEAGVTEGGALDAGGPDACAGCQGTCDFKQCTVDCAQKVCTGSLCAPTLPCKVSCPDPGSCPDILCATSDKCTIGCGDGKMPDNNACDKVTCLAGDCDITCRDSSCIGDAGVLIDASHSGALDCNGKKACSVASCNGPKCELSCQPSPGGPDEACPSVAPCTETVAGGCDGWINPKRMK